MLLSGPVIQPVLSPQKHLPASSLAHMFVTTAQAHMLLPEAVLGSSPSRACTHTRNSHTMLHPLLQVIAWANKACDNGYPDTCLHWAGFLAKLAIHYDKLSNGRADVGIMNRVGHLRKPNA